VRRGDLTGQILDDRYRVIEPIGEGNMGSVFRGERLKLGRMVAIKVLNEELQNDASRRRFEREAMAMAKLEHPHCGSVLDVGVHDGRPYVVMEFVSGQNLKELLKGPLPVARAVDITRQVLSGLAHAHEHGIIHRDIKPANIVLSQKSGLGDHVKILDFGLVRFTQQDNTNLTGGLVVGTPNYMAPEQIKGSDIDHRVDLYACGVLLFELLTGTKPFQANDPMAVCTMHINMPAPRLADKAADRAFGALEDVIARALAKNPADRFANAEEFSKALLAAGATVSDPEPEPAQTPEPVAPKPPLAPTTKFDAAEFLAQTRARTVAAAPAKRSSRLLVLIGGALALGAIAIGVFVVTRSDAEPQPAPAGEPPPVIAKPVVAVEPAPSGDAVDELVARATEMAASGRRQPALDLLLDARKSYPKDARLPYHASKLYLDKMWWADGLKQARVAIALDAKYKTDDELIKLVLKGFNTTASYDSMLARFLREDIGAAAKPYLEDTARAHPNPIVRKRAATELKRYL
jgi:hypothetical protein